MGHKYVKEEETFNTSRNGTVPKPTAEEVSAGKVLGANGTWVTGGGGGGGAVNSVNGQTGDVVLTAEDVGALPDDTPYIAKSDTNGLVKNDGTIDTNTYQQAEPGKGLSTNDYTDTEKGKVTSATEALDTTTSTISGNPVRFTTKSKQLAQSTQITFSSIQEGSGDPSPTNVRNIIGKSKIYLQECNKNIVNEIIQGSTNTDGSFSPTTIRTRNKGFLLLAGNTTYIIKSTTTASGKTMMGSYSLWKNNTEGTNERTYSSGWISLTNNTFTITTTEPTWCVISHKYTDESVLNLSDLTIQMEVGSTASDYVAPVMNLDIEIGLGTTLYGGTIDLEKGIITVDTELINLGDFNWNYSPNWGNNHVSLFYAENLDIGAGNTGLCSGYRVITTSLYSTMANNDIGINSSWISANKSVAVADSRYSNAAAFKTAVTGVKLAVKKATPTTVSIPPMLLHLLEGYNNVTVMADSISITYKNGITASLKDISDFYDWIKNYIDGTST